MTKSKKYGVNEVFYSLQGEGIRAGEPSIFVRLTGCNLRCTVEPGDKSPGGFNCDTEFVSGKKVTLEELWVWICEACSPHVEVDTDELDRGYDRPMCQWLVITGGEPGLQLDRSMCDFFHSRGMKISVETNGSMQMPLSLQGEGLAQRAKDEYGVQSLFEITGDGEMMMSVMAREECASSGRSQFVEPGFVKRYILDNFFAVDGSRCRPKWPSTRSFSVSLMK